MNRRWCFLVICAACVPTRLQRYKLREQELLDPKLHRCHDNDESDYVDEYEDDDDEEKMMMRMSMGMLITILIIMKMMMVVLKMTTTIITVIAVIITI